MDPHYLVQIAMDFEPEHFTPGWAEDLGPLSERESLYLQWWRVSFSDKLAILDRFSHEVHGRRLNEDELRLLAEYLIKDFPTLIYFDSEKEHYKEKALKRLAEKRHNYTGSIYEK